MTVSEGIEVHLGRTPSLGARKRSQRKGSLGPTRRGPGKEDMEVLQVSRAEAGETEAVALAKLQEVRTAHGVGGEGQIMEGLD